MNFTYNTTGDKTWNPDTHTYNVDTNDSWTAEGNTVKVTNHSNLPVNVAFAFAKEPDVVGTYTGTMSTASDQLTAGVENAPDTADYVESTLTLDGTLGVNNTKPTRLGTITVSLSEVQ